MQISLPPDMETLVKDKVASGRYGSTGEVLSQALLLLDEVDQLQAKRLEALRREVDRGVQSGAGTEAETVFRRVRERLGGDAS